MGRNTDWQMNPWGKTVEAQRSDLWVVEFDGVVKEFRESSLFGSGMEFYGINTSIYAQSVALPEQAVTADVVRRDSRPYNMPSWDSPLGAIRMTLIADIGNQKQGTGFTSEMVKLLTTWRAVVRAGRGGMSTEDSFTLNAYYSTAREKGGFRSPVHAFNIPIYLLKGPGTPGQELALDLTGDNAQTELDNNSELETSTKLLMMNAWLSSFQFGELSYATGQPLSITVQLFADDILPHTGQPRRYMQAL